MLHFLYTSFFLIDKKTARSFWLPCNFRFITSSFQVCIFCNLFSITNLVFLCLLRMNLHLFMSSISVHFCYIPSSHPFKIQTILDSLQLLPYITALRKEFSSSALKQNDNTSHIKRNATTSRVLRIPIITNNNDHV